MAVGLIVAAVLVGAVAGAIVAGWRTAARDDPTEDATL
jgi:hypothetical protein